MSQQGQKTNGKTFSKLIPLQEFVTQLDKEEALMAKVTIDDKEYDTDDMSEDANAQLVSLQFVNGEVLRLQALTAAMQTAANGYSVALGNALKVED